MLLYLELSLGYALLTIVEFMIDRVSVSFAYRSLGQHNLAKWSHDLFNDVCDYLDHRGSNEIWADKTKLMSSHRV